MLKVIKWVFLLSVLGGIGWIGYQWYSHESALSVDAWSYIPRDAVYCITTDDPVEAWKQIAGSNTWSHLQSNPWFAELTSSANSLDSLIRDNDLLFDLIGSRSLIASAHMTGFKQSDFLFLVDLKNASGITFLNDYLTTYTAHGMSIQKERFHEEDLITIRNAAKNSNLYLSFPGKFLVASYNRKILMSSITTGKDTLDAGKKNSMMGAVAEPGDNSLMKLYLNYTMLPAFVRSYSNVSASSVERLALTLRSTSLNVTMEDDLIKALGKTLINDSVESYVKTLMVSGAGPSEFLEIAPQRTAFALALGFDSFKEFFANFESNIRQDVSDYQSYRESLLQVEQYLDIDLQENFISWVGDEVAVLELQSYGQGLDNETAIVFKANNIGKARADLDHIEKMVRRKTPVKFKSVEYRGYPINYLSMKGLFKVLLGKFFSRYDKPYYTILNNFVIFSGHPQTLESMIDDYLDKNTLIRSPDFREFRQEFEDYGSVFIYINTPVLFNSMKKLADAGTRVSMDANRDYITSFRHVGFQLIPDESGFRTLLAEKFVAPTNRSVDSEGMSVRDVPLDEEEHSESTDVAVTPAEPSPTDPMTLPYIYVQKLNASIHKTYFPDSSIHVEVEVENGFKHGSFTEHYANGEVKMSGQFKNDKRDGAWRLYDERGKLLLKRTYDDNAIKRERANE